MATTESIKDTIEAFKAIQAQLEAKTIELEQKAKMASVPGHRAALKRTIEDLDLTQLHISERTKELEKSGRGKVVRPEQLTRYLNGEHDIYAEALETLISALPERGRLYFFGLVMASYAQQD